MNLKHLLTLWRRPRIITIGGRPFVSRGLSQRIWDDIYHQALTMRWPVFFLTAGAAFLLLNTIFASLYLLGDRPIANQFPHGFGGAFFFSVETLATVGYGDMHPQTIYAHCVATVEIFTGMACIAVTTGLIFARFSRPRAKMIFSNNPIVHTINGQQTLMVRTANMRQNVISEASAQLHMIRMESSSEGLKMRKIYDLKLVRDRHPIFILSWLLMHVIDESSPLYGLDAEAMEQTQMTLLLTIEGIDETTAQSMLARHQWRHDELRWNHRYVDLVTDDGHGLNIIDYGVFHDVVPMVDREPSG
ncbi:MULTISPECIES: ion channel [Rhodanobacter]|uniref:Potassium channel protein n=1 Tax=Rhodanobacter hydrolyticus TaxID=2250595 RepID=A0ABW8J8P0_9GAMM|nr:ion channel [Rhodanobacter sp. 7MK24]MBD8882007.1 potassium channel protein [Rhodanobacter sp. 7MK24]